MIKSCRPAALELPLWSYHLWKASWRKIIFVHLKIPWWSLWTLWEKRFPPSSCNNCRIRGTHNAEENTCWLTQPLRTNGEWEHSGEHFSVRKLYLLFTIQNRAMILPSHECPPFCRFSALLCQQFPHLIHWKWEMKFSHTPVKSPWKSTAVNIIWGIFSPCPLSGKTKQTNKKSQSQQLTKITRGKNLEIFEPSQSEGIN